ncbi:MAG: aminopeptidase [Planctomycetes bacterium]|nr:aminopeptidase [Planctomycetota bacterium]
MKLKKRTKRIALIMVVVLVLLSVSGCSCVSYYSQAVVGHFRIMRSRTPIENILKTNNLDAESQNKLKLVLEVRAYAGEELGLPKNKSYTVYSDINGEYVGWNVYVAPKFSVEPKRWRFPIAGSVVYRGYFSKKGALKFAGKMEEKDFDVFIGPINAYSTLGWYNDPVLSSHLRLNPIRLAGLIIHELAHQKFYVSGDSRFNEGFAVTVERAGVLRWLKATGRDDDIIQASRMWDEKDMMVARILKARSELMDIYRSELNLESLAQKKKSVFEDLKTDLYGVDGAEVDLSRTDGEEFELNNAYLVTIDTYYSLVPVFQSILDSLGGSLPKFFEKVEELGELPFEERQREIESLQRRIKDNQ